MSSRMEQPRTSVTELANMRIQSNSHQTISSVPINNKGNGNAKYFSQFSNEVNVCADSSKINISFTIGIQFIE